MHKSNTLAQNILFTLILIISGNSTSLFFFRPLKTTWINVTIKSMTLSRWSVASCPSRTVLLWEPLWSWTSTLEMSSQASSERKSATTVTSSG